LAHSPAGRGRKKTGISAAPNSLHSNHSGDPLYAMSWLLKPNKHIFRKSLSMLK